MEQVFLNKCMRDGDEVVNRGTPVVSNIPLKIQNQEREQQKVDKKRKLIQTYPAILKMLFRLCS